MSEGMLRLWWMLPLAHVAIGTVLVMFLQRRDRVGDVFERARILGRRLFTVLATAVIWPVGVCLAGGWPLGAAYSASVLLIVGAGYLNAVALVGLNARVSRRSQGDRQ